MPFQPVALISSTPLLVSVAVYVFLLRSSSTSLDSSVTFRDLTGSRDLTLMEMSRDL